MARQLFRAGRLIARRLALRLLPQMHPLRVYIEAIIESQDELTFDIAIAACRPVKLAAPTTPSGKCAPMPKSTRTASLWLLTPIP